MNNNKIPITLSIPITDLFPTDENKSRNGYIFTEESIENALDAFKDKPIIIDTTFEEKVIGVVSDVSNGFIWCEMNPEITIDEIVGNEIKSFSFNALSLKV